MNRDLKAKLIASGVPFHQKMLRYNYDLPVGMLREAFLIVWGILTDSFEFKAFIKTSDRIELDFASDYDFIVIPKDRARKLTKDDAAFYRFLKDVHTPPDKVGITDDKYRFYIRLFADDKENIADNEVLGGNIEVYVCDEVLCKIAEQLSARLPGHLIIDGAKKYLDEII